MHKQYFLIKLREYMGYYFDLIFEPEEINNHQTVIEKLYKTGARPFSMVRSNIQHNDINLLHPDLPFFIKVVRDKTDDERVECIDICLSWGLGSNDLTKYLKIILQLANDIDCKVYDGQLQEYVTHENIHKIIDFYSMGGKQVKDMLGIADIKKADQKISDKKFLSVIQEINPNDPILYKKIEELDLPMRKFGPYPTWGG